MLSKTIKDIINVVCGYLYLKTKSKCKNFKVSLKLLNLFTCSILHVIKIKVHRNYIFQLSVHGFPIPSSPIYRDS